MTRGSMRERSPGHFEIKYDVGRDPVTGRRRVKTKTVLGKRNAHQELRRLLSQVDNGTHTDPGKLTLGEYLDQWLAGHRVTVAPRTAERYGEWIERHIKPVIGNRLLGKLTTLDLNTLYADKLTNGRLDGQGGLSAQSVRHIDRLLHTALRDAVRHRLITFNPTDEAKRPKREQSAKATLSGEEFAALLDHAEGGRLYAAILLILATGLRRGELLALRWRNLQLDDSYLSVVEAIEETKAGLRVKPPKTKTGQRRVDLPDFAVQAMRAHMLNQKKEHLSLGLGWSLDTLVFPTPLGELWRPRNFTKSVTRLAKAAGIHFTPHLGRHDHFSRLLATGVHPKVAQVRAGHSSIAVTMDVYSHATGNLQQAATEQMEHAFQEIRKGAGGNPVAKPLPSPKGDVVSI